MTSGALARFQPAGRQRDIGGLRRRALGQRRRATIAGSASTAMTSMGISIWTGRGRATGKERKGAGQHLRQLIGVQQGVAEGGDTRHDIALRGQFMQAPIAHAELFGAVDGGDHQHGHGIGIGLAHGGEDVGHAGAGDDEADTGLAADAGIAIGHEAGTLLVARRHVADAGLGQAAIELDRVHAGNAEHQLDAISLEELHQQFAAGRHDPLSPTKSGN